MCSSIKLILIWCLMYLQYIRWQSYLVEVHGLPGGEFSLSLCQNFLLQINYQHLHFGESCWGILVHEPLICCIRNMLSFHISWILSENVSVLAVTTDLCYLFVYLPIKRQTLLPSIFFSFSDTLMFWSHSCGLTYLFMLG